MADSGDTDGVETIEHDMSSSSTSSQLSNADLSEPVGTQGHFTAVVNSLSGHFDMDNDDDGAPTSETSPKHHRGHYNTDGDDTRERIVSFDSSAESTPRKSLTKSKNSASNPQISSKPHDLSLLDMKTSWDGTVPSGTSSKAGMLADPIKIAKEREKEERVRQARERLLEERKKKLDELREQQKMAQENREKQLEMRRKKIDDLRKRDIERRTAVEERRKMKEEVEKARRECILLKAEERVARYEAWKAGGRKGGRGHVLGFGSATPRDICQPIERPRRSSSHSALQRRSPNGSDVDSVRPQRRAISACSAVRRHIDNNRIGVFGGGDSPTKQLSVSTSVLYSKRSQEYSSMNTLHPTSRPSTSVGTPTTTPTAPATTHYYPRPASAAAAATAAGGSPLSRACMTASLPSPVRIRDSKLSRKPRPASVASSMPSFIGGEPAKSQRSRSTDRTGRDRSRTRTSRKDDKTDKKKEDEKTQKQDQSEEKIQEDVKEHGEKKDKKERVSLSFLNRLSVSKYSRKDQELPAKETATKKDSHIIRIELVDERDLDGVDEPELPQQHSPRKAYSTSNLAMMKKRSSLKEKQSPTHTKEPGSKLISPKDAHHGTTPTSGGPAHTVSVPTAAVRSVSPIRKPDKSSARMVSPSHKGTEKSGSTTPVISQPPAASSTPTHGPLVSTPVPGSDLPGVVTPSPQLPAAPTADDGTTALRTSMGPTQDISAEEYKARLAEKRRQARERAEKEAEEERKRQEEARLEEEESQRKEEEEDRRLEEEAEAARKAEEERLQKAIEAEEKRRKEEAEKLEQDKKAKEEAERKAKAEMERLEKEKQEKARKDDEERLERKKKLEMIMKRVKADTDSQPKIESPTKPVSTFPGTGEASSSQSSPEEEQEGRVVTSEVSDEESSNGLSVVEGSAVEVYSADMTMSFMQGMEDVDMPASPSSAASTLSRSMLSGSILDGPSPQADAIDERLSHITGTTAVKLEDITLSESALLGKDDSLQTSIEPEEKRRSGIIDGQTKADTPSLDVQKQEKARKEDEERLERKKRLEMIMKRVKADTENQPKTDGPSKSVSMYSSVTHFSSSQSSPEEEQEKSVVSSEVSDEEGNGSPVAEGSAVEVYSAAMTMSFMQDFEDADMTASTSSSTSTVTRSASSGNILDGQSSHTEAHEQGIDDRLSQSADTTPLKPEVRTISSEPSQETKPRFKSPLLQQLVGNNGADSDGPKFKSPLLQNLLGKTRVGARMGLSASMGDLSRSREPSSQSQADMFNSQSTLSVLSKDSSSSSAEVSTQENSHEPKSVDRYMFNGVGRDSRDAQLPISSSKSSFDSSPHDSSKLHTPVMSDSALGSSIELHGDGVMSQSVLVNGHGNHKVHGMDDSSISLFSVEEGVTKSSAATFETLVESERPAKTPPAQDDDDGQFDDLINFGEAPVRGFEEGSRRSEFTTDYLS